MSTGATTLAASSETLGVGSRVADYVELAKPRITVLELVTVVAAMRLAIVAGDGAWHAWVVTAMVVGTTLLAASANTLNQYLERRPDRQMVRTRNRPLPSGRMRPREAALLGIASLAAGVTLLAIGVNGITAGLGLLSWLLYVAVYTPLKQHSTWNTFVGAASGALPIVMGWTAGGGQLDGVAVGLFAVLFLWQYPHFMAIAWLCREDYARAGYQMSTVVEPTGRQAGAKAVTCAALLAPAALLPGIALGGGSIAYATLVVVFALLQFAVAVAFYIKRNDSTARRLLRASLLYLPAWMLALTFCLP